MRRHDTQSSAVSSYEPSEAVSAALGPVVLVTDYQGIIEMKKMTPYQKQAYRNQRKAEKKHAKAQKKADKAHRKAEKTEAKFTKRADKLTSKANVSAEKAHTKVMKAADKAHIKAVKKTAKAQKKAEIATARANAKARAAQATAQIASHRIGIKSSSPSITTPPIVVRSTSERSQSYSHSSPTAGPMRPRRVTTVESSTSSRPPSREPDTQRSNSYAGHMPQPSPTTEVPPLPHAHQSHHIPHSTASAPQLPELFQSEKGQQSRRSRLEDEYAQLELDRIQLDREVVDRQISDLYAGIGKLQLDSRRNSE